jgi:isopenicillin-N epimerase
VSTPPHAFATTPRDHNELWGEGWDEVRTLWPLEPSVDHLNHGSFGAVPIPALDEQQSWRSRMEENPVRFFARELRAALDQSTLEVAQFLGAEPDGLAFVSNVSTAVSTVLTALELRPGDEIVVTDHAYGALLVAVQRFAARHGAEVRVAAIELDADDATAAGALLAAVTERTRLVIVEPVTSPTARRLPVDLVLAAAHERDVPVLVDAAHAPGMLDVSLGGSPVADFWTGNLHKWSCAPRGTGVLAVSPVWRERVTALVASWDAFAGFPGAFGITGTADYTPWLQRHGRCAR